MHNKTNQRDFLKERISHNKNFSEQREAFLEPINFQIYDSKRVEFETVLDNALFLSKKLQHFWRDNDWLFTSRYVYEYDSSYNQIKETFQILPGSSWENFHRLLYEYDYQNNMTVEIYQLWQDSGWVSYERSLFTYDSNNNCIEHLHLMSSGDIFVNRSRCFYTYDSSNRKIGHIQQLFENSVWVDWYRHNIYDYDSNGNLIFVLGQLWTDSVWMDQWKDYYEYDSNNNMIEEIGIYSWDGIEWESSAKFSNDYDANNYITETIRQDWDAWDSLKWVNVHKWIYEYEEITDIDEKEIRVNNFALSQNYPNPFNPTTKIRYSIPNQGFVTLKVFDVLGREIATLVNKEQPVGNYEVEFDASSLTSGIYFYRIQAGEFVETKKMVLMK
jgi:hypothetical protein